MIWTNKIQENRWSLSPCWGEGGMSQDWFQMIRIRSIAEKGRQKFPDIKDDEIFHQFREVNVNLSLSFAMQPPPLLISWKILDSANHDDPTWIMSIGRRCRSCLLMLKCNLTTDRFLLCLSLNRPNLCASSSWSHIHNQSWLLQSIQSEV